jgi:hypothetical protein
MMITWPDLYYHTSQDIAEKCDPTQFKRVCFIGAAAAYTIANADDQMAMKIAGEVAANASSRIGKQVQRAMNEIDPATKEDFESIYKRSKGFIEAAVINEKATILTTAELSKNTAAYAAGMNKIIASVDATGKASISEFDSYADMKAKSLGLAGINYKPTELENKAKNIIPKPTALVTENSYRGYAAFITKLDSKVRENYPMKGRGMDTQEFGRLCNGKNSALDIKKLIDTQTKQGDIDLQDVINYIGILKEAGLVTL